MTSNKRTVQQLITICKEKGIRDVVISPGSRNAPLIIGFTKDPYFNCINIPDERVAAFIALGMTQESGVPTIITCTSGSAVLNYHPAISEAFYQNLPVIVVSADRPQEWIDQADGQTIRQPNALQNHTVYNTTLFERDDHEDTQWKNSYEINKALETAIFPNPGPVHINIPFSEPLYDTDEEPLETKTFSTVIPGQSLNPQQIDQLQTEWDQLQNQLIVVGMQKPNPELEDVLFELADTDQAVVMTETTSNLSGENILTCIDRVINTIDEETLHKLKPDLLITIGGPIVSKKIKKLLRSFHIQNHWHIANQGLVLDTYKALTRHIPMKAEKVLSELDFGSDRKEYAQLWKKINAEKRTGHQNATSEVEWSDMAVFKELNAFIPNDSVIQTANSSPIRYMQLFNWNNSIVQFANRGTSGIDGCTSTALGYALKTNKLVTLITGDISFFYDSNAFFHNHVPDNLRIILINNGGGNIFRIIPGPKTSGALEQHFESHHNFHAREIAKAFWMDYEFADDEKSLQTALTKAYHEDTENAMIVEISTPREQNDLILAEYFKALKQS